MRKIFILPSLAILMIAAGANAGEAQKSCVLDVIRSLSSQNPHFNSASASEVDKQKASVTIYKYASAATQMIALKNAVGDFEAPIGNDIIKLVQTGHTDKAEALSAASLEKFINEVDVVDVTVNISGLDATYRSVCAWRDPTRTFSIMLGLQH